MEELSLAAQAHYVISGLLLGNDVYEDAYKVLSELEKHHKDVSIVKGWLE